MSSTSSGDWSVHAVTEKAIVSAVRIRRVDIVILLRCCCDTDRAKRAECRFARFRLRSAGSAIRRTTALVLTGEEFVAVRSVVASVSSLRPEALRPCLADGTPSSGISFLPGRRRLRVSLRRAMLHAPATAQTTTPSTRCRRGRAAPVPEPLSSRGRRPIIPVKTMGRTTHTESPCSSTREGCFRVRSSC
jgi:hypothetical protein